jgi:hypothetical protein
LTLKTRSADRLLCNALDIQQGSAVNGVEADYIDNGALDPGYLNCIDRDRVWPIGAPCGENTSHRACAISPGVDLKDIAFGKVHPVNNNDLATLFQAEQGVPVMLIDNQFPADRRFASLPGGHVPIGDRTSDYPDRLQDYFQCGFFLWFFHLRLFPLSNSFNGQPEIFGQICRLSRETQANHV